MIIWAIADLHLSFGVPNKEMAIFGTVWKDHALQIAQNWQNLVKPEDLVLLPGDISWAMDPKDALADLMWVDKLPGSKMMIRGNHDYWWSSLSKVQAILPPSIRAIHNNALTWGDNVVIGGTRLWDSSEFNFGPLIDVQPSQKPPKQQQDIAVLQEEKEKIFQRELGRLEISLKAMQQTKRPIRIVMTHYPPIGADLQDSKAAQLLEKYGVQVCVFGHLHNLYKGQKIFGERNGVRYILTACDYTNFFPVRIKETGDIGD